MSKVTQPEIQFDAPIEKIRKTLPKLPCAFRYTDESYNQYFLVTDENKHAIELTIYKHSVNFFGESHFMSGYIMVKHQPCEMQEWNEAVEKVREFLKKQII
jgi:hypothetical protein